jgi:hypothetical protein
MFSSQLANCHLVGEGLSSVFLLTLSLLEHLGTKTFKMNFIEMLEWIAQLKGKITFVHFKI